MLSDRRPPYDDAVPETATTTDPTAPYCAECGYDLTGCVDSSRCPECGRPLVEVLARRQWGAQTGKRYRSQVKLWGMPLIDIAFGPRGDEKQGKARGILALGDQALGVVAIGGFARGVVAVGGMSIGCFSLGGFSLGLLTAVGGGAIGGVAAGGGAAGGIAKGGGAAGFIADGGGALGVYARGGGASGTHVVNMAGRNDQAAMDMFNALDWLLGPSGSAVNIFNQFYTMLLLLIVTLGVGGIITLLVLRHESRGRRKEIFSP